MKILLSLFIICILQLQINFDIVEANNKQTSLNEKNLSYISNYSTFPSYVPTKIQKPIVSKLSTKYLKTSSSISQYSFNTNNKSLSTSKKIEKSTTLYSSITTTTLYSSITTTYSRSSNSIKNVCDLIKINIITYCGIGIKTINNKTCIKWGKSKINVEKNFENTTFCIIHKDGYNYCATELNTTDQCIPINCSENSNDTICDYNINWQSTSNTISLDFSNINKSDKQFLVFRYLDKNQCNIYKYCSNCNSTNAIIEKHFATCQQEYPSNNNKIIFNEMAQNRFHFLYILPIINDVTIGKVFNISIKTKIGEPDVPTNIRIINKTRTAINIEWNPCKENDKFGPVEIYQIHLIEVNSYDQWQYYENRANRKQERNKYYNTTLNNLLIEQLNSCTKYQITIIGKNAAGQSLTSKLEITTEPDIGTVQLQPITSQYLTTILIAWQYQYNNRHNYCPIKYDIQYYPYDNINKLITLISDYNQIYLNNLQLNKLYHVQVRVKSGYEYGFYTNFQSFYTLEEIPKSEDESINYYQNIINISWKINFNFSIINMEYFLVLTDQNGNCLQIFYYICQMCSTSFDKSIDNKLSKTINKNKYPMYIDVNNCERKNIENITNENSSFIISTTMNEEIQNGTINLFCKNIYGFPNIWKRNFNFPTKSEESYLYIMDMILTVLIILGILYFAHLRGCFRKRKKFTPRNGLNIVSKDLLLTRMVNEDPKLVQEYQNLCQASMKAEQISGCTMLAAQLEENKNRNRFNNIFPFDHSRVKLNGISDNNYINASFIPFDCKEYKVECIASQGPLNNSIFDFWLMIWEQNISIIVMLTRLSEGVHDKCSRYWPINENKEELSNEEFSIKLNSEKNNNFFIERILILTNKTTNETRTIRQLHMISWSDFSAPLLKEFETFIKRFHEIFSLENASPYLVHCSAGVGRTGTFIVIDRIINKIKKGETLINIYNEVMELRKHRRFMVQQKSQYIFIHDFFLYYLKQSVNITPTVNDEKPLIENEIQ